MKLPITDKFLWDIYNFVEKVDSSRGILRPMTMKEALCPDFRKLKEDYERKMDRKNFNQLICYLKRKGYIRAKNLEGKKAILLTKQGIDKAIRAKLQMTKKRKRKDGRWIMLIFDIPENKRNLRYLLTSTLSFLGYQMFQKSVWVCPYDVLKETEVFIVRNALDEYVRIFLVEEIG
jgi:hypothetical protein